MKTLTLAIIALFLTPYVSNATDHDIFGDAELSTVVTPEVIVMSNVLGQEQEVAPPVFEDEAVAPQGDSCGLDSCGSCGNADGISSNGLFPRIREWRATRIEARQGMFSRLRDRISNRRSRFSERRVFRFRERRVFRFRLFGRRS